MPRYYAEEEKITDELEQMFIDEISMQKDIKIISLMQTLGHKALNIVKRNATADVQEVKHGKWVTKNNGTKNIYYCSECDRHIECRFPNPETIFPYCHCGAKMDGDDK